MVHTLLAELLESFRKSGVDATQRTEVGHFDSRLEVLAQYDSNLEPIVKSAVQIQRHLTDTPNLEVVQRLLEDFR